MLVLYIEDGIQVTTSVDIDMLSSVVMCNLLRRHRRSLDASVLRVGQLHRRAMISAMDMVFCTSAQSKIYQQ